MTNICTTTLITFDIDEILENFWKSVHMFRGLSLNPATIWIEIPWTATCDRTEPCPEENYVCSLGVGADDAHGKVMVPIPLKKVIPSLSDKCLDAINGCDYIIAIPEAVCLANLFSDPKGDCVDDIIFLMTDKGTPPDFSVFPPKLGKLPAGSAAAGHILKLITNALAAVDHDFECKCLQRSSYSNADSIEHSIRSFNHKLKNNFETMVKLEISRI